MKLHYRDRAAKKYRGVLLNGVERPKAIYADSREGKIREWVTNENGNVRVFTTPGGNSEIRSRELRGKVTWVRR